MPLPPLIRRRWSGSFLREGEPPLSRGEADGLPLLRELTEVLADPSVRVGRDRELDQAVPRRGGVGHGVATGVAHPVDLHGELGVLAGAEARPVPVGAEGDRHTAGCGPGHRHHLGSYLGGRPGGPHQLDVAVDPVGGGHGVGHTQGPAEDPTGERAGRKNAHWHKRTVAYAAAPGQAPLLRPVPQLGLVRPGPRAENGLGGPSSQPVIWSAPVARSRRARRAAGPPRRAR